MVLGQTKIYRAKNYVSDIQKNRIKNQDIVLSPDTLLLSTAVGRGSAFIYVLCQPRPCST